MFLSQGAHEAAGLAGSGSFIDRHKDDILEKLVIYFNMDHLTAIETEPEQVGEENVGTKALILCAVPDVPVFIDIITKAVMEYVPTKVMVAPDWGFWGTPGEPIWLDLGYRVCDFISGPSYYHTPDDTLDKIDPEQLVPHTKFYIEVVTALDDVPTNLIDTCPPLPTPVYYGIEPTPPIPRTLYVGCGSMRTDDKYKGKGALFETEDTIYLGVEESNWIAWDIVQQWEDTDVTIYECQSEWGTLWVYTYKELCLAKGSGTFFVGKDV